MQKDMSRVLSIRPKKPAGPLARVANLAKPGSPREIAVAILREAKSGDSILDSGRTFRFRPSIAVLRTELEFSILSPEILVGRVRASAPEGPQQQIEETVPRNSR